MYEERTPWLEGACVLGAAFVAHPLILSLGLMWEITPLPAWMILVLALVGWLAVRIPLLAGFALVEAGKLTLVALWLYPQISEQMLTVLYQATAWWQEMLAGLSNAPAGGFARLLMALTAVLSGAMIPLEARRSGSALLTLTGGTALLGLAWLLGYDTAWPLYLRFLGATLLLWSAAAAYARDMRWKAAGRRILGETDVFFTALAFLLLFAAAWVIPAPGEGVNLGAAGEWVQRNLPVLRWLRGGTEEWGGDGGFSLAEVGFARRMGELGGPVLLSDKVALQVRSGSVMPTHPLYLRGRSRIAYTGRGWEPGAVFDTPPPNYPDGAPIHLTVDLVNLDSATLFYPRELVRVAVPHRIDGEENVTGSARTYEVVIALGGSSTAHDVERYLQLPPSLPERVRQEAARVAGQGPDPLARAEALEEYLRRFPYSLAVPATPSGRDFVDYFLFELRRGYCTYSATAMTVMLRSLGVPARWVEGFVLEAGQSNVLYRHAHAWVEVYAEGRGWVIFDPTPRFPLPVRDLSPVATVPGEAGEREQPLPQTRGQNVQLPAGAFQPAALPRIWPGLGVAAMCGALSLLWWLWRRGRSGRISWRDDRAAPQEAFDLAARLLAARGLHRQKHQTELEYARGVGAVFPEVKEPISTLAAEATRARFSAPGALLQEGAARALGALKAVREWLGRNRKARARSEQG